MKRIFMLLCLFFFLATGEDNARACSCGLLWPGDVPESKYPAIRKYWLEDFKGAIFVGRVAKLEKVKVRGRGGPEEMRKGHGQSRGALGRGWQPRGRSLLIAGELR